jgi:hypothetical protein
VLTFRSARGAGAPPALGTEPRRTGACFDVRVGTADNPIRLRPAQARASLGHRWQGAEFSEHRTRIVTGSSIACVRRLSKAAWLGTSSSTESPLRSRHARTQSWTRPSPIFLAAGWANGAQSRIGPCARCKPTPRSFWSPFQSPWRQLQCWWLSPCCGARWCSSSSSSDTDAIRPEAPGRTLPGTASERPTAHKAADPPCRDSGQRLPGATLFPAARAVATRRARRRLHQRLSCERP